MILDSVMIPEHSLNREIRFDASSPFLAVPSDTRCEEPYLVIPQGPIP
jgi:hypothetical protein